MEKLSELLGITKDPPLDPITGELTAPFKPTKKPVSVTDVENAWREGREAFDRGDYAQARELFTFVLHCCPTWPHAYFALGWVESAQVNWLGEIDRAAALADFNLALGFARMDPQTVVRFLRSLGPLKRVDWSVWWPEPLSPTFDRSPPPHWTGEPCENLLVMTLRGNGAGDLFYQARFLPLVAERVKQLVVAPARLQPLLSHMPTVLYNDPEVALKSASACVMIEELPRLLKRVTAPTRGYLSAPPGVAAPALVRNASGLKIAFAWRGNQKDSLDPQRRTRIEDWRPLFEATKETATWFACATDYSADLRILEAANVVDLTLALTDWGATAAALMECDLVITVDTGLAHLAAVPGRPTWLLLGPHQQDYWGENGSSPWYPEVKIFRQAGDWRSVFSAVRAALRF